MSANTYATQSKRRQSSPNMLGATAQSVMPLTASLQGMIYKNQKKMVRKAPIPGKGEPPALLTDAQVLSFRAEYEFYGTKLGVLAEKYGIPIKYAKQLAKYHVLAALVPKRSQRKDPESGCINDG